MDIISRQKAKETGLVFYFTGKACKRGHTSKRYTSGGKCIECSIQRAEKLLKTDPDKKKEAHKKYRENNLEKVRLATKKWELTNPEKVKLNSKKYREDNPEAIKSGDW